MAPGRGLTRQPQPSITGGNVKGEVGAESYKSPDGNHPQSFAATAEVTAHRNSNRYAPTPTGALRPKPRPVPQSLD